MSKKTLAITLVIALSIFWTLLGVGAGDDTLAPQVVDTNPRNGAKDVDQNLDKVTVTFSKPMMDRSWSWSYEDKASFPQTMGQPSYINNGKTCVLPVKLEPGKQYVIWINTKRFKNFKDMNGNPVEPYKLTFTTRRK